MENVVDAVAKLVGSNRVLQETNDYLVGKTRMLERENEELRSHSCDCRRFYNCAFNTTTVAELHSVSPHLVRCYVKRGLIPTHPMSSDSRILVRASDALMLDFREMKRIYLNQK